MSCPRCQGIDRGRGSTRRPLRLAGVALVTLVVASTAVRGQEETVGSRSWSNKTELSLVETGGNSESSTFSMKNRYSRTWARSKLTVDANALRADSTERVLANEGGEVRETEIDTVTAEQYGLSLKLDHSIDERLGWFALGGWSRNQLAGIDARYNFDTGISYLFTDTDRQRFVTEAGLGFTDEHPVVGAAESFATARGMARYERRLSATSTLETEFEAIENLDRTGDLRINYLLGVTAKINAKLALKASYTLRYDGEPASQILPGDDPGEPDALFEFDSTDTVLAVSLVIDF